MPQFSSKHGQREQVVSFSSFAGGYNKDRAAPFLSLNELSFCRNMKYASSAGSSGEQVVTIKMRQGTEKISTVALPLAADVLACTYYIAGAKYILATASKLYYLDGDLEPVEIGTIEGVPMFTEFHGKLIIHDSGITKEWNGTTFAKLTCYYVDEVIGTGDVGGTVAFTPTLANPAVKPSSLTITYTAGGLTKTITDNGSGALTGDLDGGETKTITYSTGALVFTCSAAPDNATSIYASYEKVDGAPKSKGGMVRASRLYMWGDSVNPERLWYSGPNDEDAWDDSSDGGYLDVNADDGYDLVSAVSFFQSVLLLKENGLHRLDNFPGDTTFRVEPLMYADGCVAYRTVINDGKIISYLTPSKWAAMVPTEVYGDVQKDVSLSAKFSKQCLTNADTHAYAEYNETDNQLWLQLYDTTMSMYFTYLYVINLASGGQLSEYQFAFTSTCFKWCDGTMLIGGADGHLYRLRGDENSFDDAGVAYPNSDFLKSAFVNLTLPFNRKHNKKVNLKIDGLAGTSGNLDIYTNRNYSPAITIPFELPLGAAYIHDQGQYLYIGDCDIGMGTSGGDFSFRRRFNWREIMWGLSGLSAPLGVEVYGLDLMFAIIGD